MHNMYYGSSGDRYHDYIGDSTSHKLKSAYWNTRQAVIRKLGKEEDRHVVASDAELDAKLELFKSVQNTCQDLSNCIDAYLRCIFVLSQVENDTGRFLNSCSSEDHTRAGKMLSAVGKALSHSAQQRLMLQQPLSRLEAEVATFRGRAIGDTSVTLSRMESARTAYRGALAWMASVSNELDPDAYKKLERFRRVQTQVKTAKASFDRLKLAAMQKVDLLAASRCNMLSHVLAAYQDTLLRFWERTAITMTTVANSFKGYQYYEFALLKDLTPESRKLAEQTSQFYEGGDAPQSGSEGDRHSDGDDFQDGDEEDERNIAETRGHERAEKKGGEDAAKPPEDLLPEEEIDKQLNELFSATDLGIGDKESGVGDLNDLFFSSADNTSSTTTSGGATDMLKYLGPSGEGSKNAGEDADFLNEILSMGHPAPNLFGDDEVPASPLKAPTSSEVANDTFFHVNWESQLSDVFSSSSTSNPLPQPTPVSQLAPSAAGIPSHTPAATLSEQKQGPPASFSSSKASKNPKKPDSHDLESWMKFFADLTPMGNPDEASRNQGHVLDA